MQEFISEAVAEAVRKVALDLLNLMVENFDYGASELEAQYEADEVTGNRVYTAYQENGGLTRRLSHSDKLQLARMYCAMLNSRFGIMAPRVGSTLDWAPSYQIVEQAEKLARTYGGALESMKNDIEGRGIYTQLKLAWADPYEGGPCDLAVSDDTVAGKEQKVREYRSWNHYVVDLSGEGRAETKRNMENRVESHVLPFEMTTLATQVYIVCTLRKT